MDYEAEKQMELEALEAIYMDDFKVVKDDPCTVEIILVPHQGDSEENHVSVKVTLVFTPTYPEELPLIEVENLKGLQNSQIVAIKDILTPLANDSIGMSMAFTLCQAVVDYLVENNQPELDMHAEMMKRLELEKKQEEAENQTGVEQGGEESEAKRKAFHGTPVTKELFLEWSTKFRKEMHEKAKRRADYVDIKNKLTGRQLFEKDSTLSTSDSKFVTQEGGDDAPDFDPKNAPAINEALFDDEDDFTDSDEEDEEEN